MTKKRWTVEDKAKIVTESLTTTASTADICRKYGPSPNTFYPWREKFLESGRAALAGGPSARATKALQKENATLKTPVGEITLANDALKGLLRNSILTPLKPADRLFDRRSSPHAATSKHARRPGYWKYCHQGHSGETSFHD